MISTGSSSVVAKTSELAMAPTGQPSWRAAAAAVGAGSARIRTRPGSPAAARMSFTAWLLGCSFIDLNLLMLRRTQQSQGDDPLNPRGYPAHNKARPPARPGPWDDA